MESTENGSIDDTLDTRNLEDSAEHLEDIVVASCEDCKSEVPSCQAEENQSVGQGLGYLELKFPSGHTIYINPQDLNIDGQHLILVQNNEGELVLLYPDGQESVFLKKESTENGSIDDTLDTRNLEDPAEHLEDIVVASNEDCKSEVPSCSCQAEENQSVGQVLGYLELKTPSGETHIVHINPQDFMTDGRHFVVAEDGEVVELVLLDPDGQLSNESSLHPGGGGFEDGPSQSWRGGARRKP